MTSGGSDSKTVVTPAIPGILIANRKNSSTCGILVILVWPIDSGFWCLWQLLKTESLEF